MITRTELDHTPEEPVNGWLFLACGLVLGVWCLWRAVVRR